jgi:hypothetical protein
MAAAYHRQAFAEICGRTDQTRQSGRFCQDMGGVVMTSDVQTAAIMSAGMKLLRDNLGALETEIFIMKIGSNDFDYTKWRKDLWEGLTPRELFDRAAKTTKKYVPPAEVDVL